MTWRLAIDRQRADRRRSARELQAGSAAPELTLNEGPTAAKQAAELWEAIDALPEKLRLVTVLAGIEGHNVREVGRLLGLQDGTVKSRLFLARRRLKERLQWTKTER
jgi:RNA polymerase sigma-70 factor (ECF subfamily)